MELTRRNKVMNLNFRAFKITIKNARGKQIKRLSFWQDFMAEEMFWRCVASDRVVTMWGWNNGWKRIESINGADFD